MAETIIRKRISITGRVQGVGFRPAVHRIAGGLDLAGLVYNDSGGVTIELQGADDAIGEFLRRLRGPDLPPLARISSCRAVRIEPLPEETIFRIAVSDGSGPPESEVTPDAAVCGDCLREFKDTGNFRHRYPFINCTNCGPRYSIVKTIPYDRTNTTMSAFRMCRRCDGQYRDKADRRFHAQPVACAACGPEIWLTDEQGNRICTGTDETIVGARGILAGGGIVAIKGVGGFHLAVDALNEAAVQRLRQRKKRDLKPFALMTDAVEKICRHAVVGDKERALLTDPTAPIVLLPKKAGSVVAPSVAPGVGCLGFMLCYAPLHHLLFEKGIEVLVMTSGNIADQPLISDNGRALRQLGGIADAFLMHDRDIYRQVDDSVVHLVAGGPAVLRRARGYVPSPVMVDINFAGDVLAAGADLKNTFCLGKDKRLICSEHIGDLAEAAAYRHYLASIEHLKGLFQVTPRVVACDLHPAYMSTRHAESIKADKLVRVQHHWAHAASVLAEHGMQGPVIALICDGTGYGTDGNIWGCECLEASLGGFKRLGHLAYWPLAGGDVAATQAVRSVMGLLLHAYGERFDPDDFAWLLDGIEPSRSRLRTMFSQLTSGVNTVRTSSLGRMFDAVAAMTGLGSYNFYEAQLPMQLEAAVGDGVEDHYEPEIADGDGDCFLLDLRGVIRAIVEDVRRGRPLGEISAAFHNGLASGLASMAVRAAGGNDPGAVALSGGVFCNRYLVGRLSSLLQRAGFSVLLNRVFPANDGGIAVGQAAIAAASSKTEARFRI